MAIDLDGPIPDRVRALLLAKPEHRPPRKQGLCAIFGNRCACRSNPALCERLGNCARQVVSRETSYGYREALKRWREYSPYNNQASRVLDNLVALSLGITSPSLFDSAIMTILLLDINDSLDAEVYSINHRPAEKDAPEWDQDITEEEQGGVVVKLAPGRVHFKPIGDHESDH